MPIDPPRLEPNHPDYNLECQQAIEAPLMELVDAAARAGWSQRRVFLAAADVIANLARAYEEDPDPADASVEILGA